MKVSKDCINLIKKWESFRSNVYKCSAGKLTIGYGSTRNVTAITPPIKEWQAVKLLAVDIAIFEAQLIPVLKGIKLRQCQYDAIVSFCFNLGVGAFKKSNAYTHMKQSPDRKQIADSWITFRNAGGKYLRGLMKRRIEELSLYYNW